MFVLQRVINATVVVQHMRRLQISHADPVVSAPPPSIEVMDVSSVSPPAEDLDTNGNPSCSHMSLSPQCDVIIRRGPLKACNSEPMHALVISESGQHTYHSESDLACAADRYNDSLLFYIDSTLNSSQVTHQCLCVSERVVLMGVVSLCRPESAL